MSLPIAFSYSPHFFLPLSSYLSLYLPFSVHLFLSTSISPVLPGCRSPSVFFPLPSLSLRACLSFPVSASHYLSFSLSLHPPLFLPPPAFSFIFVFPVLLDFLILSINALQQALLTRTMSREDVRPTFLTHFPRIWQYRTELYIDGKRKFFPVWNIMPRSNWHKRFAFSSTRGGASSAMRETTASHVTNPLPPTGLCWRISPLYPSFWKC